MNIVYTANATIETYVLRGSPDGELSTPGWNTFGEFTLNTAGEYVFVVEDVNKLEVLFTLIGCKLSNESVQFPTRGLNTKSTSWRVSRIIPGLIAHAEPKKS